MSNILTAFNDHFAEFINDVHLVFPQDADILSAKNALLAIRKANPKMIVKIWNSFIVGKYRLRGPIKNMSTENQSKVMKYIQNLTRLSEMCE